MIEFIFCIVGGFLVAGVPIILPLLFLEYFK
jgi:hypothetical protein